MIVKNEHLCVNIHLDENKITLAELTNIESNDEIHVTKLSITRLEDAFALTRILECRIIMFIESNVINCEVV